MSTTDRPDASAPAASDVAATLREAGFVRLVAAPTGDAVAAAGLLARALPDTPYQVTVAALPGEARRGTEADCTVGLGLDTGEVSVLERPASRLAYEAAGTLGETDPWLALAGMAAGGAQPGGAPLETADPDRRPGLSVPTADPVDGLAHTTLAAGPFSGDPAAAEEVLDGVEGDGDEARRRRASLAALAVADDATARGAEAVERLLRPYVGGPFHTVGGYADVLDAAARVRPGLGAALAVGGGDRESALDAWRTRGERAHGALAEATTARYDGLLVAQCSDGAPLGTVARLFAQFRSPEPVTLAVADGRAAAYAVDETDAGRVAATAARTTGGEASGTPRAARAGFDAGATEFTVAFREAL